MLKDIGACRKLKFFPPILRLSIRPFVHLLLLATFSPVLALPQSQAGGNTDDSGLSANPAAVNTIAGIGELGHVLGSDKTGIQLGGLWLGDANYLVAGGTESRRQSFNSLLILDANVDLSKRLKLPGAMLGVEFLQFNGQASNAQAGVISGYNSLPGLPPLNRSELYQLWWRQEAWDGKFIVRLGKMVPTNDFNNVTRPLQVQDVSLAIPAVSGLIFTPLFVNPTLLGAMPGYYNSAYGVETTVAPTRNFYLSYGLYDGAGARGIDQTGLRAIPIFNGYYFNVGETGYAWLLGAQRMPGSAAFGAWGQTGKLSGGNDVNENGALGLYAFINQRLWLHRPRIDNSGITGFLQYGVNNSSTMIVNKYVGGGFTGFGLVPRRPKDSLGVGFGASWLNQNFGFRRNEAMFQAYYQMNVVGSVYLQPTVSYIPNPGQNPTLSAATAITMRVTFLF
jgi:porin